MGGLGMVRCTGRRERGVPAPQVPADCAEHVLGLFEALHSDHCRGARSAAVAAHAAARAAAGAAGAAAEERHWQEQHLPEHLRPIAFHAPSG